MPRSGETATLRSS